MTRDLLFWIGTGAAMSMVLPLTYFLYRYVRYSNWRSTMPGKALAYLAAALDIVLIVGMVYLVVPALPGWSYVRAVCYVVLAVTVWALPIVLIKMQREGHDIPAEAAEAVNGNGGNTPPEGIPRFEREDV